MAAINRRELRGMRSVRVTLATADDLNGTVDNTQAYDVSGCTRVLIIQDNNGTAGTLGVDRVEVSHDNGTTWAADDTVLNITENDSTGTIQASGALNSAGTEPTTTAIFTAGPWQGQTAIRIGRGGTGAGGTAWTTGAPSVYAVIFGYNGGGTPTALA